MALTLSRIDRVYRYYDVTVTDPDGAEAAIAGVDVALLAPRTTPDADTAWTAATFAAGEVTVLLAGPDADATDALVVPAVGADLWVRVTDTEVTATHAERLTVR